MNGAESVCSCTLRMESVVGWRFVRTRWAAHLLLDVGCAMSILRKDPRPLVAWKWIQQTQFPVHSRKHGESESHKKAFEKMQLALQPDSSSHVVESGDSSIPKITRFMLAATVVSRHDSFSDYSAYMNVIASTSVSLEGSDLSRQGCLKMVQCMALPLERCDQDVMRHVSRQLHCNTCFKFGLVELTLN